MNATCTLRLSRCHCGKRSAACNCNRTWQLTKCERASRGATDRVGETHPPHLPFVADQPKPAAVHDWHVRYASNLPAAQAHSSVNSTAHTSTLREVVAPSSMWRRQLASCLRLRFLRACVAQGVAVAVCRTIHSTAVPVRLPCVCQFATSNCNIFLCRGKRCSWYAHAHAARGCAPAAMARMCA